MIRLIAAALACVALAACTTTNTKLAADAMASRPAAGANIVVMTPDVQLAVLTASGMTEPRADWSRQGRDNLTTSIRAQLAAKSHEFSVADPDEAMEGRTGQLLRLNSTVGAAIMNHSYGLYPLPTKKDAFNWTIGDGAQVLAQRYGADYALFFTGQGTYASEARVATALGLALLGVSVPLGQQVVYASLVDLRTGKVVWFNMAIAGPQADMRKPDGSDSLVTAVFKDLPL